VLNPEYTIKNILKLLKDDGKFFLILPYPDTGAADPSNDLRYKVHCGVIPLGLHVTDQAITTTNIIKNMGCNVIDTSFCDYREPEIHLTLTKLCYD
jgi:hypothetical protein